MATTDTTTTTTTPEQASWNAFRASRAAKQAAGPKPRLIDRRREKSRKELDAEFNAAAKRGESWKLLDTHVASKFTTTPGNALPITHSNGRYDDEKVIRKDRWATDVEWERWMNQPTGSADIEVDVELKGFGKPDRAGWRK